MKRLNQFATAISMVLTTSFGVAGEFPEAPPNLKEMEATGLPRLSAAELKAFFPGAIESKGTKGKHLLILKPDGTAERKGGQAQRDLTGKWRIDEAKNAWCTEFWLRKGFENNCFAVFRAKDGMHYFDYDVDNGFYAHVWRRAEGQ